MKLDLGDTTLVVELLVKGHRRQRFVIHASVPSDTTPEDRVVKGPPYHHPSGKVDFIMDLAADKKVTLTGGWTDEVGNPVPTPPDASVAYTNDNPTVINLTDNGDGTAVAAAVGALGTANIQGTATSAEGVLTGDFQIVVVAGLGERFTITAGEPEEVTPDDVP